MLALSAFTTSARNTPSLASLTFTGFATVDVVLEVPDDFGFMEGIFLPVTYDD